MKGLKVFRSILVIAALGIVLVMVVNARITLFRNESQLRQMREEISKANETVASEPSPEVTTPEVVDETEALPTEAAEEVLAAIDEPEEELPPKYDWCTGLKDFTSEGILSIHCESNESGETIDIQVKCQVGGDNLDSISGDVCGLHPQISNENHMFILSHNNTNWYRTHGYSRLNTAFTYLTDVVPGSEVIFETVHGYTYHFVIDEMVRVCEDDYMADNYSMLCGDEDLVLATCCWNDDFSVRSRLVCFCSLTEVTPNN